MKKTFLHTLVLLFLVSMSFSCRPNRQSVFALQHAEILMEEHPDSSLILLKNLKPDLLSTADYARYCLLMTEAIGKNHLSITSDSLISVAVEYFNDKGDIDTKAKTYFYAGWVNQEMQNTKQAMEYFLKAADFAEGGNDYKLQYLIHYYLGNLYFQENLYDSALKMHRIAYYYSRLLNNKDYMAYALRNTAIAYSGKGNNDSALIYYYRSLNVLPKSDTMTLVTLMNEIAGTYNEEGNYGRAIQLVNKALELKQSSTDLSYPYIIKAYAYYNLLQYDSATYYYNKTLYSKDLYTKADSYYKLSKIEKRRGNLLKAFNYNDIYLSYRDSLEKQLHSDMVIKMQNIYQHKKTVEKIQYLTLEKNQQKIILYLISAISVSLLFFLVSMLLLYRNRKERQTSELELTLRQEKEESQMAKVRLQESELIRVKKEKELLEKEMELRTDFFNRLNNLTFPFLTINEQGGVGLSLTDEDWNAIVKNTDAAFNYFSYRLAEAFPELRRDEILFCCLVKMKLGLGTLSSVYNLTKDAISKRKERIRKNKMKIEDGRSLEQFLAEF